MKLTQQKIAEHIDISQQNVSLFLKDMDSDWRHKTLDEIRIYYINKLRTQAAKLSNEDYSLVGERILTERVKREEKEFELTEKRAQLINLAQFIPEMETMVSYFRQVMATENIKLKATLDKTYGIDVDIHFLNEINDDAFRHFGKFDVSKRVAGQQN